jgi:hypothetical protein
MVGMIMQRQPQLCSTWLLVRVVVEHIRRLSRARQTLPARDRLRFACTMWAWHGATRWQGKVRRWRQVCLPPPRVAAPGLSRRFGLLRCTVWECVRELVVSELRVQSHQTDAENVQLCSFKSLTSPLHLVPVSRSPVPLRQRTSWHRGRSGSPGRCRQHHRHPSRRSRGYRRRMSVPAAC